MIFNWKHIQKKRRDLSCYLFFLTNLFYSPGLGKLTLIILPTLAYGCSSVLRFEEQTGLSEICIVNTVTNHKKYCLDVLSFNDDVLGRLDSYQRFDNLNNNNIVIASGSGDKIIYAIANSGMERLEWAEINSIEATKKLKSDLKNDHPDNPVLSGSIRTHTGNSSGEKELILTPLSSIVEIRSLRCDFTGLPYSEEKIMEAKAYLLNINAECPYMTDEPLLPSKLINQGRFSESDVEDFPDKNLFLHKFGNEIGNKRINENVRLICYPNATEEESVGSPFTKLVIEGKISGNTYYWTIPVNRQRGERQGIWRNCKYIFDIDIRRKGTTEPDIDIAVEDITFKMEIEKWEDKDNYEIIF